MHLGRGPTLHLPPSLALSTLGETTLLKPPCSPGPGNGGSALHWGLCLGGRAPPQVPPIRPAARLEGTWVFSGPTRP